MNSKLFPPSLITHITETIDDKKIPLVEITMKLGYYCISENNDPELEKIYQKEGYFDVTEHLDPYRPVTNIILGNSYTYKVISAKYKLHLKHKLCDAFGEDIMVCVGITGNGLASWNTVPAARTFIMLHINDEGRVKYFRLNCIIKTTTYSYNKVKRLFAGMTENVE